MAKLYMGFDAGTQSVKVAVYDEQFKPLASHSLPTTLHYPQPGWVQMNIDEFLNITVECMKKTVEDIKGKGYLKTLGKYYIVDTIAERLILTTERENKKETIYINKK